LKEWVESVTFAAVLRISPPISAGGTRSCASADTPTRSARGVNPTEKPIDFIAESITEVREDPRRQNRMRISGFSDAHQKIF